MNKILFFIAAFIIAHTTLHAQNAQTILLNVSNKIKNSAGITANFAFTTLDKNKENKGSTKGILYVKGNKYYIKQGSNEIFFNGGSVWNFNGSDEVQITNPLRDADALTPQKLLSGDFLKGFNATLTSSAGANHVIELVPEDKRRNFSKIDVIVSKALSMITSAKILDKNGNTSSFVFSNIKTNVQIPDNKFTFDMRKYPGIEVVD